MSYNLVLNSNNAINNSTFQYQFINGSFSIHDEAELCISNIQIPYSWYNIAPIYNNQTFQIRFPVNGASVYTGTVTIPSGFYTVNDINAYLQKYCITNNLYLINSVGQYVYYLTFLYNETYYGVQLITNLLPTSLPSGWTAPTGWLGYPYIPSCPQITITNNFGKIIGFLPGTYPSVNTANASILNTFTPLGSNINSLVIRCSLVDNQVGVPTDILDTMPVNTTFGSNINYQPPALKWIKLTAGTYQYLTITFVDQNLNSIFAQDPNVTISLLLNNKGKVKEKVIPKLNIVI